MLVPAMNDKEVTAAMLSDLARLIDTTVNRLFDEYERERRKLGIDKTKVYPRSYPVKTAAKNTWIIFIQKPPAEPKFRNSYDARACAVVYYYSKQGLQVLRWVGDEKVMEVFYGHFFTRYNQRMNLNLHSQVDIIRAFFSNNELINSLMYPEGEKTYVFGTCKDGVAMGQFYADSNWRVFKTFVSHEIKHKGQNEKEGLVNTLLMVQSIKKILAEDKEEDVLQEALKNMTR